MVVAAGPSLQQLLADTGLIAFQEPLAFDIGGSNSATI